MKKVHRLWCEEGLHRQVYRPRKRAGMSSVPEVVAHAPKAVWAIDFQFDSTVDGKAIKIASMVDEHTRESLLHLVERSITASISSSNSRRFSAPPAGRRRCCGWTTVQSWFRKRCNSSVRKKSVCPTFRPEPWNNGYIESFNNRLRTECH